MARLTGMLVAAAFLALFAVMMFGCAGRWDVRQFWVYLGIWAVASLVGLFVADPTLIKERIKPGPGGRDYTTALVFMPVWLAQHAIAGLDVGRYHWSDSVPSALLWIAMALAAAAWGVVTWAVAVNPFFSSVIRLQTDRGHHIITSGPYRFVRHPAYAVAPFFLIAAGIALGSWIAGGIGLVIFLAVLRRAVQEDRFLQENLEGYREYSRRVRYRLLPGVW